MDKLIIEARVNEVASKASNPHIPYVPEEIVTDALACAAAGASIVHFHARTSEGKESNDPDAYGAVIKDLRNKSDMLIHTTLGQFEGTPAAQRTAHVEKLHSQGLAPDIVPLDMGSNNVDFFDPTTRRFAPGGYVYMNATADLQAMAERFKGWNIKPQLVLYSIPNGRLMSAFLDAGLVTQPAFVAFTLAGGGALAGHPPTLRGLQPLVDLCVDQRVTWTVLCYRADFMPLVPDIVRLGGHIAIGLGDYHFPELGTPTNADLVKEVAKIARAAGRAIATPAETRKILKI
jgi:3-keto-5-aminohexanoate cleavage enzyme